MNSLVEKVTESLINGQFVQAYDQAREGCRTKPDKLAHRVGRITWHLCRNHPDLVSTWLRLFK